MNLQRPDYCCGKCPETTSGYDCTCQDNPKCGNYQMSIARALDQINETLTRLLAVYGIVQVSPEDWPDEDRGGFGSTGVK